MERPRLPPWSHRKKSYYRTERASWRKTVLRPDIAEKGTDRDRLFKNVPEKDNYYIKVPAILEDGGDA